MTAEFTPRGFFTPRESGSRPVASNKQPNGQGDAAASDGAVTPGPLASMRNRLSRIVNSWGTRATFHVYQYVWVLAMLAVLAALETNRIGLFLVPPFGATLTILLVLPDASIAQPYALIAGSVTGAALGTVLSIYHRGPVVAIVAAFLAFAVLNLMRSYHPPGVALAMYPPLLHAGLWFPVAVVLPFTTVAVASAALLSRMVKSWPQYPKPLRQSFPSQIPPREPQSPYPG